MKRAFALLLAATLLLCAFPVKVMAATYPVEIVYLDDGSYFTVEITSNGIRAAGSVTGNKVYTHYAASGSVNWKVVLTGSFTYTGADSTCTSSSVDVTVYDNTWYVSYKYAGKSGNSATASVAMSRTLDGTTITRIPVSLTLTCDANGNLS